MGALLHPDGLSELLIASASLDALRAIDNIYAV